MTALSLRDLNQATLRRQLLIERADEPVAAVLGRLAGLQAQHSTWPYVALWTRRQTTDVTELQGALADRSAVKATLMRTTLHLVDAADAKTFDVMSAQGRLPVWGPSARRAGLDLLALNAEVRAFCQEPRTVAEIEAHLGELHPSTDPYEHIPPGPRNAWFRLGTAGGGLVHLPPSGFWAEHGKPSYVDIDVWLGGSSGPAAGKAADRAVDSAADGAADVALRTGIERFLTAYGPATLDDLMQWSGQRRAAGMRAAVKALDDRLVRFDGPDGETYLDLGGLEPPADDAPAPPRFLARWDSLLIAYAKKTRARLIDPEHTDAVYKKNGDVLPTFLVDGRVAGLWSTETVKDHATLRIEPFASVPSKDRAALTDEAERLVRYTAPDAETHEVTWAS